MNRDKKKKRFTTKRSRIVIFFFVRNGLIRRPHINYVCLSVPCTLYQVPGTSYTIPDMYTAAVLVQSKVSIEPPQHRPSARAASACAALSTPSERRDRTQMPSVLGESRESCRLNNTPSLTATNRSGIYRSIPWALRSAGGIHHPLRLLRNAT